MTLLHIAAKNVRIQKFKAAVLVVGLAVGVATVVALLSVSAAMRSDIQDKIDEYGANMVVAPESKSLPLTYGGVTIGGFSYDSKLLTEDDAAKIRTIKNAANINIVAPKLMGLTTLNGERAILTGVRINDEFKLKKWWKLRSGARPAKSDEVMLGGKLADEKGLKPGDYVKIGEARYRVSGLLSRVGSQDDELLYVDLKAAQTALGKPGAVSLIEVSAWCKNCPIEEIARQTKRIIPGATVSAVRQVAKSRDAVVKQFFSFAAILSVTMTAIASLVVFSNVLSAVRDRRKEIGIFRAVGYRKKHVLQIILSEMAVIGVVAGVTGWAAGFGAARFIGPLAAGLDVIPAFDWRLAAISMVAPIVISLLASLYPAISAANTDPAEALKAF